MSVILAKKVQSSRDAPAAFQAKKLFSHAPSAINQLSIQGITRFPEVAYGAYRQHIEAFCTASILNKKVFANAEGFSDITYETAFSFSEHPLVFSPNAKLTSDQANAAVKKLGEGASMRIVGKTLEFTIAKPAFPDMEKFLRLANPQFAPGPDRFVPAGFRALHKALTILDAFLRTNYYPAFKDLTTEIPQTSSFDFGMYGRNEGKKRYFYTYVEGQKSAETLQDHSALMGRRKRARGDEEEIEMETDLEQLTLEAGQSFGSFGFDGIGDAVIHAKPSGRVSSMNFGAPGNVPVLPGLLFPYFDGLNRPDYTTIREIFIQHFFRLFGETFESCKEKHAEYKQGIQNLCNTKAGMELTHVFKGIQLALQTQTRLYVLFDAGYKGFLLLGAQFSIWDGSKWVNPVSPEELKVEISLMDTHGRNITRIAEMLSDMTLKNKRKETVTAADLNSATELMGKMKIRSFEEFEGKKEFDECLQGLVWPKDYWKISPASLLSFLSNYSSEGAPSPNPEYPMYIPSCDSPISDTLFQHLAVFGPDAPSMWNTRGSAYALVPGSTRKSDKGKEKEEEMPAAPKELIILPKPLLVAYRDWNKVFNTAMISMNPAERAKEYRGHVVQDVEVKQKLWAKLQEVVTKKSSIEATEPESKKKKIEPVYSADDFLNLL